jgi:hypothetical protein
MRAVFAEVLVRRKQRVARVFDCMARLDCAALSRVCAIALYRLFEHVRSIRDSRACRIRVCECTFSIANELSWKLDTLQSFQFTNSLLLAYTHWCAHEYAPKRSIRRKTAR